MLLFRRSCHCVVVRYTLNTVSFAFIYVMRTICLVYYTIQQQNRSQYAHIHAHAHAHTLPLSNRST